MARGTENQSKIVRELMAKYFADEIPENDLNRMSITLDMIPHAKSSGQSLVDVGGTIHWLPVYIELLGYCSVTFVNRPEYIFSERLIDLENRLQDKYQIIDADVDRESFDIPDQSVTVAVCFEVLEHLPGDPMNLVAEVNRILKPEGKFLLSTPNVLYKINLLKYLFGKHPFLWSVYTCRYADRHNREFTPAEAEILLRAGGLSVDDLTTRTADPKAWIYRFIASLLCFVPAVTGHVPYRLRNQYIFAACRSTGPVRDRYPADLYEMYGMDTVSFPKRR